MTYLFTKQGCGKCDWIKNKLDLATMDNVQVMQLGEDPEALAMLAYYECVTLAEKMLPILVEEENGNVITGAALIRKYLEDHRC